MRRLRRALAIAAVSAVVITMATPALGQGDKGTARAAESEASSELAGVLYCVEFRGPCGPPVMPSFLASKIVSAFNNRGMDVTIAGNTPLMSRQDLKYSLVAAQGETDLRTGRIYAEVGPGSELNLKTDKGTSVVLQVDISQVCWDLDRAAAMADAKEAKRGHAILARFQVDDLTEDVNPHGELAKQKSVRVNLDLVVVDAATGAVVAAFSEECRQMDLSLESAISNGAKYLAGLAAESVEKAPGEDK